MTMQDISIPEAPAVAAAGAAFPDPGLRYLEVADTIGCRLVRDAVWSGDRCGWLIWTREPVGRAFRAVHRAAPADLYLGAGGIGVFLAHLANATHDRHQREAAVGAARRVHEELSARVPAGTGLYTGAGGAARALVMIGDALGEERWIEAGTAALAEIAGRAAAGDGHDLLSGHAGLVLALVDAAGRFGRPELLDEAARLGGLLVEAAVPSAEGASWPSGVGETRNLLGLSHGTTGIALALLELDRVRPDPRLRDTAREALRYERAFFDTQRRNWPDFRTMPGAPPQPPAFLVGWCHGSTGMGMARLRMRELLADDPWLLPEIDAALSNAVAALNAPTGNDFSPCHGATGNGELLLLTGRRFNRPDAVAAAARLGDVGYESFHAPRVPWGCGIPQCGETPSLMTGTAGIGLFYLRLYDPGVPGVLLPEVSTGE
jgi:lantibiotic modifying enzyme